MDVTTCETLLFRKLTHAGSAGIIKNKRNIKNEINKTKIKNDDHQRDEIYVRNGSHERRRLYERNGSYG